MKKGYVWLIYWAAVFLLACSPENRDVPTGGGAVVEIPTEPPLVAITFDDGPHISNTRRLLDGLSAREIPPPSFW